MFRSPGMFRVTILLSNLPCVPVVPTVPTVPIAPPVPSRLRFAGMGEAPGVERSRCEMSQPPLAPAPLRWYAPKPGGPPLRESERSASTTCGCASGFSSGLLAMTSARPTAAGVRDRRRRRPCPGRLRRVGEGGGRPRGGGAGAYRAGRGAYRAPGGTVGRGRTLRALTVRPHITQVALACWHRNAAGDPRGRHRPSAGRPNEGETGPCPRLDWTWPGEVRAELRYPSPGAQPLPGQEITRGTASRCRPRRP
jgi:hypothetical protein